MERVRVIMCSKCKLRWIDEGRLDRCPNCRGWKSIAAGEVKLTTQMGELDGLPAAERRFYDGERCEHGYLSGHICPSCNT